MHSTHNTSSFALDVAEAVVQVGNLRSCALAGRTRSTSAGAKADLPRRKLPSMSQTLAERSAPPTDLSAATDDRDRPLPVSGFKGTHEEIEQQWYEQVY